MLKFRYALETARLAQLVERQFCKLDVAGSIPAPGSIPLSRLPRSKESEVDFDDGMEFHGLAVLHARLESPLPDRFYCLFIETHAKTFDDAKIPRGTPAVSIVIDNTTIPASFACLACSE